MKIFIIGMILSLPFLAAQTLQIENATEDGTEIEAPKGKVVELPEYHHFTSEDGVADFKMPRTDLVNPIISASFFNNVYVYTVTNNQPSLRPIEIIQFLDGVSLKEVETDSRFIFVENGWISAAGGLPVGGTAIFKFSSPSQKQGFIKLKFMNVAELVETPVIPYGLKVYMRNHVRNHDSVVLKVMGPK